MSFMDNDASTVNGSQKKDDKGENTLQNVSERQDLEDVFDEHNDVNYGKLRAVDKFEE